MTKIPFVGILCVDQSHWLDFLSGPNPGDSFCKTAKSRRETDTGPEGYGCPQG